MNELQLSKRLEEVVKLIPSNAAIADIGSDHAYLPCYAYLKGFIKSAIAGEITDGPFQSAVQQVRKTGLEQVIEVRKGDGLEVISPNEVDCITIAGMGGTLIRTILEEGKNKLEGVQRLVLQPNIGAKTLREWLLEHSWEIKEEKILEEDGRIYEIIAAEQGEALKPYGKEKEAGLLLGPILMREKSAAFIKKWTHEQKHWEKVITQLDSVEETPENKARKEELQRAIAIIKGVLSNE
ncbi:tRNA (adenine(22)-N(1))-methyltransferase [Priestia abyssalis]|uniref:tRNA (adenine(22)-N(1))-methyltransferase n=1 Tax=Priestia abyssalis TaxID=1221450 RepID=UPI00099596F8|nr:tRNA (adenine(22)-N(1))-methyltransferase TrmK [Priestia abyssalis]